MLEKQDRTASNRLVRKASGPFPQDRQSPHQLVLRDEDASSIVMQDRVCYLFQMIAISVRRTHFAGLSRTCASQATLVD